mmetsp:Transcript_1811/g.5275  ORF Transcript_1811/g.5275 Transcript_1811/m.5275 type:complete len:200 (+) Transcript_1811:2069-2668(+)
MARPRISLSSSSSSSASGTFAAAAPPFFFLELARCEIAFRVEARFLPAALAASSAPSSSPKSLDMGARRRKCLDLEPFLPPSDSRSCDRRANLASVTTRLRTSSSSSSDESSSLLLSPSVLRLAAIFIFIAAAASASSSRSISEEDVSPSSRVALPPSLSCSSLFFIKAAAFTKLLTCSSISGTLPATLELSFWAKSLS